MIVGIGIACIVVSIATSGGCVREDDEGYDDRSAKPRKRIMRSTPPDPIEEILARPPRRRTDRPTE